MSLHIETHQVHAPNKKRGGELEADDSLYPFCASRWKWKNVLHRCWAKDAAPCVESRREEVKRMPPPPPPTSLFLVFGSHGLTATRKDYWRVLSEWSPPFQNNHRWPQNHRYNSTAVNCFSRALHLSPQRIWLGRFVLQNVYHVVQGPSNWIPFTGWAPPLWRCQRKEPNAFFPTVKGKGKTSRDRKDEVMRTNVIRGSLRGTHICLQVLYHAPQNRKGGINNSRNYMWSNVESGTSVSVSIC